MDRFRDAIGLTPARAALARVVLKGPGDGKEIQGQFVLVARVASVQPFAVRRRLENPLHTLSERELPP
jgi:hypothetical protein